MKVNGLSECAWVTVVTGESDVLKACILVSSIKRVLTSHKIVCIYLESGLSDKNRGDLTSSGFNQIVVSNVPTNDQSIRAILQDAAVKESLNNFKKVILLPVDSIMLKNCDALMSSQNENTILKAMNDDDSINLLATNLEKCLIISKESEGEQNYYLAFDSLRISNEGQSVCLNEIPSVIRLPDINSEVLTKPYSADLGLVEKEIFRYWNIVYNNLKSANESNNDACTWFSEPISIIGTADSSGSIREAANSAFKEAGLASSTLTQSSCTIFATTHDQPSLSEFASSIQQSSKLLLKLETVACSSSTSALTQAIKKLHDFATLTSIIFYKDANAKISVLILKRASQAISDGDKTQALLGPCSVSSSTIQDGGKIDDLQIPDVVDTVRFLNLRGPIINKPWLHLLTLSPTHKRESAVIPHFFDSSNSLVISTSYIENVEGNYPSWNLSSYILKRPLHCIALQHGNPTGLEKMLQNLRSHLTSSNQSVPFTDLAYTLNTKLLSSCENLQYGSRAMIIAKDSTEALNTKAYLKDDFRLPNNKQKICFLFTGQGSQFPGMAKSLYETCPVFRLSMDHCNSIFRKNHGIDLLQVIYKDSAELSRTLYSQTSIFCLEYALLQTWKSWGVEPDVVVGHSLGEFTAAVAAGILDLEDALMLVANRSRLIDELPRGKMLVLRGDQRTVQNLLNEFRRDNMGSWLDFAAINSKDQTVLSGDSRWVEQFSAWVGKKNVASIVLEASHAFHSRHMEPMLEKYKKVAETCKGDLMPKNGCVYVSAVDGKVAKTPLNPDYWARHTRDPVKFVQASRALWDEGCRVFVECGPQPILMTFARVNMMGLNGGNKSEAPVFLPSIRKGGDDWKTMLDTLGKLWLQGSRQVDWKGFEKHFGRKFVQDDVMVAREISLE